MLSYCFLAVSFNIAYNDSSLQLMYQNVQQQVLVQGACDEPKRACDGPCDPSCDHEEEEQPLMNSNNYQFC